MDGIGTIQTGAANYDAAQDVQVDNQQNTPIQNVGWQSTTNPANSNDGGTSQTQGSTNALNNIALSLSGSDFGSSVGTDQKFTNPLDIIKNLFQPNAAAPTNPAPVLNPLDVIKNLFQPHNENQANTPGLTNTIPSETGFLPADALAMNKLAGVNLTGRK